MRTKGPRRAVAGVPHAMAVDQQNNFLDDDAAAVELNSRSASQDWLKPMLMNLIINTHSGSSVVLVA